MTSAAKRRAPSRYSARVRPGGALSTHHVTPRSASRASSSRTALGVVLLGQRERVEADVERCRHVPARSRRCAGTRAVRRARRSSRAGECAPHAPPRRGWGTAPSRRRVRPRAGSRRGCCRRSRSAGGRALGARPHRRAARAEVAALVLERVGREREPDHVDRFVGERVAFVEVDAERGELRFEVAGGDAEDHAALRQRVEGQQRLRGEQRVAIREHHHMRLQAQPGRRSRRERRARSVGSSAWWPPAASHFASGAGWSVTKQASKPDRLDRGRAFHHRVAGDELVGVLDAVGGQSDAEAHGGGRYSVRAR